MGGPDGLSRAANVPRKVELLLRSEAWPAARLRRFGRERLAEQLGGRPLEELPLLDRAARSTSGRAVPAGFLGEPAGVRVVLDPHRARAFRDGSGKRRTFTRECERPRPWAGD